MNNLNRHFWILWALALIAAAALAALIPFTRNTVWWIGAGCTLLMFALAAAAAWRAFRRGEGLLSKLLGWPIFKTALTALIVQLVVGFALMGLSAICPWWAAVIAEVAVFAFALAVMTVRDAAREVVTESEQTVRDLTGPWKAIRRRAAEVAAATNHPDIKKLAEDIRYADPTPTPMDGQIADMLETLSSYADAENIAKAQQLLRQRNAMAKAGK